MTIIISVTPEYASKLLPTPILLALSFQYIVSAFIAFLRFVTMSARSNRYQKTATEPNSDPDEKDVSGGEHTVASSLR